jgi:very-short-patch-repair endonuclease|tara:strand:- start:5409 stop:6290 length:882 start_codon:yes stop_codon:yes gene_type:complete
MSKIIKKCKECKECNNEFESYIKANKKFCNKKCYGKFMNGEGNPFYGKTHTDKTKQTIGKKNSINMMGKNNHFYGKHHSEKSIEKIKQNMPDMNGENNHFYGKTHTPETSKFISEINKELWKDDEYREKQSKAFSEGQKKSRDKNPEYYSEIKRKAGSVSHHNQHRYKKNNPEKKFEKILNDNKIEYDYSPVMSEYQYDFKIKNKRILIEIDGDYWHSNPKFYNEDGSNGRRKLNNIQINKKKKDKKKEESADKHDFKLIRIWESDLDNDNLIQEVLDEIQTYENKINKEKTI